MQKLSDESISSALHWRKVLRGIHDGERGYLEPEELQSCLVEVSTFEFEVIDAMGTRNPGRVVTETVRLNVRKLAVLGFIPMPSASLLSRWPHQVSIEVPEEFAAWLTAMDGPQPQADLDSQCAILSFPASPTFQNGTEASCG